MMQTSPSFGHVSILILCPTRELAIQTSTEATRLLAIFKRPIEVQAAFGGLARASMMNKFKEGDPKILVATPGRLKDYLAVEELRQRFQSMQTLILDEADAMLEAGMRIDCLI